MREVVREMLEQHLYVHIVVVCVCVASMLTAMAVDLIFGIRKARALGEATTSTGYKMTCEKGRKYFMPFSVLACIDVVACVIMPMPLFSMIWAAWCIFCEFKSVREKAWTKAELRKAERTMSIIIENKDDIAKAVAQMLLSAGEQSEE